LGCWGQDFSFGITKFGLAIAIHADVKAAFVHSAVVVTAECDQVVEPGLTAIGSAEALMAKAKSLGQVWMKGIRGELATKNSARTTYLSETPRV